MSEIIAETIVPGTYIEVRAEGLLTIGGIATGNVAIIGTAERGGDRIESVGSYEEGRARFGEPGAWDSAAGDENLSLVRALRLLFDNGATTVYARRVYDSNAAPARHTLKAKGGTDALMLEALSPGEWGNRLVIQVEEHDAREQIADELVKRNGNLVLSATGLPTPPSSNGGASNGGSAVEQIGTISVRDNGLSRKYPLQLKGPQGSSPATGVVTVDPSNRLLDTSKITLPEKGEIRASYAVPKEFLHKVTFQFGNQREVYIVPSVAYLKQLLRDPMNPSKLVKVSEQPSTANGSTSAPTNVLPQTLTAAAFAGGSNGGAATPEMIQEALDEFVEQNIQIVVVAGANFSQVRAAVLGHVEKTENVGRERIAVLGADRKDVDTVLKNANEVADKRLILVAPGLTYQDSQTGKMIELPPSYAAAAVAGKLASFAPHISLTNKTLAGIEGISAIYNYGELKSLIQNRVLALQKKRGIRVVKGITTHDEAFQQITLRRIVDYCKEGTRIGANQYIGKLNNKRVRENLRTTLDSFLADLVVREFLTGYKLTVFADHAMEIRGEVLVTMDLYPTFSIDIIRVTMNLS